MRTNMSTYLGTEPITAPSHAIAPPRKDKFQSYEAGEVDCSAELARIPCPSGTWLPDVR